VPVRVIEAIASAGEDASLALSMTVAGTPA